MQTSVKLTKAQYDLALLISGGVTELLEQAAPTDETPLEITILEFLEVGGKRMQAYKAGN